MLYALHKTVSTAYLILCYLMRMVLLFMNIPEHLKQVPQ